MRGPPTSGKRLRRINEPGIKGKEASLVVGLGVSDETIQSRDEVFSKGISVTES